MWLGLVLAAARADTITLDTGGVVEGELARFEHGGDCHVSVDDGPLQGAIVIVPCYRVVSFQRTSRAPPPAVGAPAAATSPPSLPTPPTPVPAPVVAPVPPPLPEEAVATVDLAPAPLAMPVAPPPTLPTTPEREERVGSTVVIAY
jgi:hypothetical protein